jgi:tetratricopeptide (TPR) repeat protein
MLGVALHSTLAWDRRFAEVPVRAICLTFAVLLGSTSSTQASALDWLQEGIESNKNGYWETSVEYLTRAIDSGELSGRSAAVAFSQRCAAYSGLEMPNKAVPDCRHSMGLDPTLGSAYVNLSVALLKQQKWDESIAVLNQARKRAAMSKSHWAALYLNRGLALHQLENYDSAIQDFAVALQYEPGNVLVLTARATSWIVIGSLDQALEDVNAALELEPGFPNAWKMRSLVWLKMDRYAEGISDATKYIDLVVNLGEPEKLDLLAYLLRGYGYLQQGDHEAAIADLTMAIDGNVGVKSEKNKPVAYFYRSLAWRRSGRPDLADLDLHKALKADPNVEERAGLLFSPNAED